MPRRPEKPAAKSRVTVYAALAILITMAAGATLWFGASNSDGRDLQKVLGDNGFVELKPPSTLIQPGTWVEVQARNPLRLRTVCSAESALHLTPEQLATSLSADTSVTRAFNGSFSIGSQILGAGDAIGQTKVVTAVQLKLSNVRLIELAADQIVKNLPKRELFCTEAIKIRYETDPKSLTMIDTVLIADAEYHFRFDGQMDNAAKTAVVKEFAAKSQLSVDASRSTVVLGSNLVWGVKDNQIMAHRGIALPSVGAESEGKRSILQDSGAIVAVDQAQQGRLGFDQMAVRIRLDVPILKQPTPMSCWATVYAMLMSWKAHERISIESAIAGLGAPYTKYLADDRGLPGGQERAFVKAAGLQAMPPASYPLSSFRRILRERGPAWIITGNGITSHAQLLVGLYGPNEKEERATYEGTVMEFIDPRHGAYLYQPALTFYAEFEREAGHIVSNKFDSIDLRWQVISY